MGEDDNDDAVATAVPDGDAFVLRKRSLRFPRGAAPVVAYMGFVNVTILEKPEEVSWRIVDSVSKEQFYGYPAGNYKEATASSLNLIHMHTGLWELLLHRESVDTAVTAEIGTIHTITGAVEPLGKLGFAPGSTNLSASATFSLD